MPEAERDAVWKTLEHNIVVRRRGHIDAGSLGSWFLIQCLQQFGRNNLIYAMVNQKTYPGWGYMVEQGALRFGNSGTAMRPKAATAIRPSGVGFNRDWGGFFPMRPSPVFGKSSLSRPLWAT